MKFFGGNEIGSLHESDLSGFRERGREATTGGLAGAVSTDFLIDIYSSDNALLENIARLSPVVVSLGVAAVGIALWGRMSWELGQRQSANLQTEAQILGTEGEQ